MTNISAWSSYEEEEKHFSKNSNFSVSIQPKIKTEAVHGIPDELWKEAFFYLPNKDYLSVRQICKRFYLLLVDKSCVIEHFKYQTNHLNLPLLIRNFNTLPFSLDGSFSDMHAKLKSFENQNKKQIDVLYQETNIHLRMMGQRALSFQKIDKENIDPRLGNQTQYEEFPLNKLIKIVRNSHSNKFPNNAIKGHVLCLNQKKSRFYRKNMNSIRHYSTVHYRLSLNPRNMNNLKFSRN